MNDRRYLSIGEVLGLLLEEFPDVTISKIRFLESQGLIDPERTASGYRKFYDADVERLRVILREQRENYLPLKVIKDRLDSGELTGEGDDTPTGSIRLPRHRGAAWFETRRPDDERAVDPDLPATAEPRPSSPTVAAPIPQRSTGGPVTQVSAGRPMAAPVLSETNAARLMAAPVRAEATNIRPIVAPAVAESALEGPASGPEAGAARPASAPDSRDGALPAPLGRVAGPDNSSPSAPTPPPPPVDRSDATGRIGRGVGPDAGTTLDDLCTLAGVEPSFLAELESYGLVESRQLGAFRTYDGDAVRAVLAAAGLCQRGLEPRHLRLWRTTVDKELGLIEQLVLPLMRQRNPKAREHAAEVAHDIEALGADLRAALARAALRHLIG